MYDPNDDTDGQGLGAALWRERSADQAADDLITCTESFNDTLRNLAMAFPGVVAIGGLVSGTPLEALALTPCTDGDCFTPFSPEAMPQVLALAGVVASLPAELLAGFQIQLNGLVTQKKLRAEAKKAVAAALKAAAGETK